MYSSDFYTKVVVKWKTPNESILNIFDHKTFRKIIVIFDQFQIEKNFQIDKLDQLYWNESHLLMSYL